MKLLTTRILYIVLFFIALIYASGCEDDTSKPETLVKEAPQKDTSAAIELPALGEDDLTALIQERNGKPLLINVWATWCVPCVEEFPDLIKLAAEYKGELDVVGINADMRRDIESQVIPFLKEQNVNFPVYYTGFPKDEDLINYLNFEWSGALPGTFIYDKDGNQTVFYEGKKSYEEFEEAVKPLL